MWPDGLRRLNVPQKTAEEKARCRVEVELRLQSLCEGRLLYFRCSFFMDNSSMGNIENFGFLLGRQVIQESISDVIAAFSNKFINKHLAYVLLDLIVVHLVPDASLSGSRNTRGQRM
jgi:hypothetical protein